jgi:DNA-binding NarL/FixJ family response regulator
MIEKEIKAGVVDDQHLFRKGIIALLNSLKGIHVLLEAGNGNDLIKQLSDIEEKPDVLLLDLKMPGMDGIETTKILRKDHPGIKIIILSIYNDERFILHLLECGAHAYVFKDAEPEELEKAIRAVANDGFYFTGKILEVLQRHQKKRKGSLNLDHSHYQFTEREAEVLKLICREYTTEEIAKELSISPRTVEGHRNNLLLKTGSKNVAGLVVTAIKNRLVDFIY